MRVLLIAALAGCYPPHDPPGDPSSSLALFFPMDETGDGPRLDRIADVRVFPWKRLGFGVYHQDGIGTTAVPAVVGDGQHIDGAAGYHFAAASQRAMDHGANSFAWAGWASIDPPDGVYVDNQTLVAKWTAIPDTDVPPDRREYRVWFEPALGNWRFEVSSDGLDGEQHSIIVTHPTAIERDRMYFIEAWYDADARSVNLRVSDREARGEIESVAWERGVYSGDGDLDVGAQNQCSEHHLQGTIDALGFWTRAPTEADSIASWNGGNGTEP